jgi:hypothetical protein
MPAVGLIAWTQHLLLHGDLARAEPKTLRYRLHVAACPTRGQRRLWLRIRQSWPWARQLAGSFARSRRCPFPLVGLPSRHDERREPHVHRPNDPAEANKSDHKISSQLRE